MGAECGGLCYIRSEGSKGMLVEKYVSNRINPL